MKIELEEVQPEKFVVYRTSTRSCKLICFVHPRNKKMVDARLAASKRAGFGQQTQLMYMSTYVVDLNTNSMVKNRYPDRPWPKQIMEEVFSGVGDENYV